MYPRSSEIPRLGPPVEVVVVVVTVAIVMV